MKKLMLFMFVIIFLVGTISALEWDNVKDYNEETKEYLIENAFGLGDDIAKIKLTSNLNQIVPRGYQKVAEFEVENYDNYTNVFNDMEFYDLKNNRESFTRDFDYKYKTIIQVPNYITICEKGLNENLTISDICRAEQIGFYDKIIWENINESNGLLRGNITIGIFTDVKKGDRVEWIPTLFGERLTEWAVWTESLNVNLVSYYKLDQTYGNDTVVDSLGNFTGINNGATRGEDGIINNSFNFTAGNSDWVNLTFMNVSSGIDQFSISVWINPKTSGARYILAKELGGASNDSFLLDFTSPTVRFIVWNASGSTATVNSETIIINEWTHLVGVYNGSHLTIYTNGSEGTPSIHTGNIRDEINNIVTIGSRSDVASFFDGSIDEVGIWDRALSSSEVSDLYNNGNGITFTTFFGPSVTLNFPTDAFNTNNGTINFNGTVTSPLGFTNVTLFIDGVLNETNSSGINDTDYLFTKTLTTGSHNWTYESCNVNGCTIATTRTFTFEDFTTNQFTFNASSFETEEESFTVNITTNGSVPTNTKLIYNGTTFSDATVTNTSENDFNITRTIAIPTGVTTNSFHFNFTLNGAKFSTSSQNQTINATTFVNCVNQTPVYINLTFKNETVGEESISAEIDTDWNFWLGDGSVFKTLSFTNTTENFDYGFCLTSGGNRTLNTNVSLTYDNSISQQRNFASSFTLTNVTTNQTLFLLPTTEGVFVTFQTVTVAEQIITDVFSNVTRNEDLISFGITDDAGLVQYFLDPDTTYVFSFFKEGFDLVTTTLKPTQSSFTIIMGGEAIIVQNDTTKGISYFTNPLSNVLSNNTETEFNLSFFSVFWGLESFGFVLKNSTGDVFNKTTSTAGSGGFLSRNLNTGSNTDIQMEIFWTINGNQTNVTRTWLVIDTSDERFSIKTFFDDLSTFLTSGIFGLTSFGLGIIIFMIILITTGILSFKFGITNPAGISIILFALVLFFDVGLGIMPNPVNAVPNFPTIFVGLVFLGVLLKEAIIR